MIKLQIGGEERSLDFTRMGVYTYIKQATGLEDPFEFLKKFEVKDRVLMTIVEDAAVILFAGLNTACDVEDKENIPFDKVKKWTNTLKADELTPVIESFFTGITAGVKKEETPGELQAQ